jgi:hypothetical protein
MMRSCSDHGGRGGQEEEFRSFKALTSTETPITAETAEHAERFFSAVSAGSALTVRVMRSQEENLVYSGFHLHSHDDHRGNRRTRRAILLGGPGEFRVDRPCHAKSVNLSEF